MAKAPYISEFKISSVDETYVYYSFKISNYVAALPDIEDSQNGDIAYKASSPKVICSSNDKSSYLTGSNLKLEHGVSKGDTKTYYLEAEFSYQKYVCEKSDSARLPADGSYYPNPVPEYVKDGWTEHKVYLDGMADPYYYYTKSGALSWEKSGSKQTDSESVSFVVAIQNPSGDFKFLNKDGKPLSSGDTFPLSAINGSQGIRNMNDFQSAAEAWYKWKNGTAKTCPSWDDGTGKLTAAQVNKIFAYVGLTGGYSQGDPISFDIFSKLQNRISE